jgi:AcrR family transcriptional regulator
VGLTQGGERQRLPRGRHDLGTAQVERSQRERLVAAMAEACAERGYLATSVSDVSKRAGVSTQTFYKLFSNKLDCMLVTYDELLGRVFAEMAAARDAVSGGEERLRHSIRIGLAILASDPITARVLTVEIMVAGTEGVNRHYESCEFLASRLRGMRRPDLPPAPVANWALVATMGMRIAREVSDGEAENLGALEDEFVAIAALMGLGT